MDECYFNRCSLRGGLLYCTFARYFYRKDTFLQHIEPLPSHSKSVQTSKGKNLLIRREEIYSIETFIFYAFIRVCYIFISGLCCLTVVRRCALCAVTVLHDCYIVTTGTLVVVLYNVSDITYYIFDIE
jgi:hypothetical protein